MTLAVLSNQRGLHRFFHPIVSPTRVFMGTPYALAMLFPNPALTLHVFDGLTRLIGGLLTAAVLRRLFPREQVAPYLGCCLFICATPDFLTNATMGLGYEVSAALYVASFVFLLGWWELGRVKSLVGALVFLELSLWTTDTGLAPALIAPILLWTWIRRDKARLFVTLGAWYSAILPYLFVLIPWLRSGQGYAATALVPMPAGQRASLALRLFAYNFTPWSWAFGRRDWFPAPVGPISLKLELLLAAAATIFFISGYWRGVSSGHKELTDSRSVHFGAISGVFLLSALACNAAYSFVQFAPEYLRTHLMSVYFMALAVASLAVGQGVLRKRLLLVVCAGFVFLGVCGGVNRQNYFAGYWRLHREELRSILDNVPRLVPSARLVLRIPPRQPFLLATEAEYLSRCWTQLLYSDRSVGLRTFLWAEHRGTSCHFEAGKVRCRRATGEVVEFNLKDCVILSYEATRNRFELSRLSEIENEPRLYDPSLNIAAAPMTPFASHLLRIGRP
jgi:hypothetical protein